MSKEAAFYHSSTPNRPQNWEIFSGAGFNVNIHVSMLQKDYQVDRQKGLSHEAAIRSFFPRNREEIVGFKSEYLDRASVYHYRFQPTSEHSDHLYAHGYSKPLVDCISDQERLGAPKSAVDAFEQFILKAKPGSVAGYTSPIGWSGLEDNKGGQIEFVDTQTYIFQKDDSGLISAFTVPTNMDLDENQRLLISLGVSPEKFLTKNDDDFYNPQKRLANLTGNYFTLEATDTQKFDAHYVVQKMEQSRKVKYANLLMTPEGNTIVSFADIYANLKRRAEFFKLNQTCDQLIQDLENFLLTTPDMETELGRKRITKKLSETLLKISRVVRGNNKTDYQTVSKMTELDLRREFTIVQKRRGCAGGGGKELEIMKTAQGPRAIEIKTASQEVGYWTPNKDCVKEFCGRKNVDVGPCGWCRTCQLGDDLGKAA